MDTPRNYTELETIVAEHGKKVSNFLLTIDEHNKQIERPLLQLLILNETPTYSEEKSQAYGETVTGIKRPRMPSDVLTLAEMLKLSRVFAFPNSRQTSTIPQPTADLHNDYRQLISNAAAFHSVLLQAIAPQRAAQQEEKGVQLYEEPSAVAEHRLIRKIRQLTQSAHQPTDPKEALPVADYAFSTAVNHFTESLLPLQQPLIDYPFTEHGASRAVEQDFSRDKLATYERKFRGLQRLVGQLQPRFYFGHLPTSQGLREKYVAYEREQKPQYNSAVELKDMFSVLPSPQENLSKPHGMNIEV